MDSQTAYEIWAPRHSVWSAWAKSVLFAHLPRSKVELPPLPPPNTSWVPAPTTRAAIVVELPGAESVAMGLALAELGYRPVPLFNACPPPRDPQRASQVALIDVDSILTALVAGCDRLSQIQLPNDAPPAFLIDSLRQHPTQPATEGRFDNRSLVFVTDFPSANFLSAQGIQQAIWVCQNQQGLKPDLAHSLRTWQKAKVELQVVELLGTTRLELLTLPQTAWLTGLQIRLCASLGFRRNQKGGFGNFIPESSSG